jgi:hypothetical protein
MRHPRQVCRGSYVTSSTVYVSSVAYIQSLQTLPRDSTCDPTYLHLPGPFTFSFAGNLFASHIAHRRSSGLEQFMSVIERRDRKQRVDKASTDVVRHESIRQTQGYRGIIDDQCHAQRTLRKLSGYRIYQDGVYDLHSNVSYVWSPISAFAR